MRDGYRILDIDRHVLEPVDMWREYLPSAMRAYAPRLEPFRSCNHGRGASWPWLGEQALLPAPPMLCVDGVPIMRGLTQAGYAQLGQIAADRAAILAAAVTVRGHLDQMNASGIDIAVMHPTYAWYLVYDDAIDAERSRAYAEAYNRWLLDFCAPAAARLLRPAIISRHDPDAMVRDLERAVHSGALAIVLRPNPVQGRTLGDPSHARFWAACAYHSIPILIHEGANARVSTTGADRFTTRFAQHACSHPMEAMMALLSLIEGGVLEANPALRVALLESGCGWLPYWLWRLDHEYDHLRSELPMLSRSPSDYVRRQCWITLEPSEAMLDRLVPEIGPHRLVFGTDFPHLDHDEGIADEMMHKRAVLDEAALATILWTSPCELMGIDAQQPSIEDDSTWNARKSRCDPAAMPPGR